MHIYRRHIFQTNSKKLDIYKRIAGVETEEDGDEMLEELIDRFGEPPKSVISLLNVARLKAAAHSVYIKRNKTKWTDFKNHNV